MATQTQRGIVIEAPNSPLVVGELTIAEPASDELLVKLLFSGVCATDLHIWEQKPDLDCKYPVVPGHEGVGDVARVGASVVGWKIGDRVGIQFVNRMCGVCEFCLLGYESSCPNARQTGFNCDGTFQQFAIVSAQSAIPLPPGVDLAEAAPILCAGTTVYRGLRDGALRPGQFVAVVGAGGGLGCLAVQYARAMSYHVVGIDTAAKRDRVLELGAEFYVAIDDDGVDVAAEVKRLTNGGAHLVLNVANPIVATQNSLDYVRTRGMVQTIALDDGELRVPLCSTTRRALTIKGVVIGNRADACEALAFLARGLVRTPVEIVRLDDVERTLKRLRDGTIAGRVVIDLWKR